MHLDRITEAIAHFVGLFQIASEQNRMRDDYLKFVALRAHQDVAPQDDHAQISFKSPYTLDDPEPELHYVPASSPLEPFIPNAQPAYLPVSIPESAYVQPIIYPGYVPPHYLQHHNASSSKVLELDPPGSVVSRVLQENNLSDNDFVNTTDSNATFSSIVNANAALGSLADQAEHFQLTPPPTALGSADDIGLFITGSADSINAFIADLKSTDQALEPSARHESADGPIITTATNVVDNQDGSSTQTHVTAVEGPTNGAMYVNGNEVAEAPKLDDHLPSASPLVKETAEPTVAQATIDNGQPGGDNFVLGQGTSAVSDAVQGQGSMDLSTSVEISTGANALVNSALLINNALEGNVVAVAGNHFKLNAIVQVNAWSDSDSVGASMSGWGASASHVSNAFNIASIKQSDVASHNEVASDDGQMLFPRAWAVTEISGDFISLNWVQQHNFIIDNDMVISSSSAGVTSMIGTGANQALNALSIADLGNHYDLILVGGNYFNANIISQMNILLDDDVVGGLAGFQTSGQGSLSTSDNLLWNEASISNIGGGTTSKMPGAFQTAIDDFSAGNKVLTSSVLTDSSFLGLSGIKVLYISGSIYDLQYVQQTNVLGDADQIATTMHTANIADDASWTITTGSNALINTAQIISVDPIGKTYFGGEHYSDELLVQTDIIRTDHVLEVNNGDHLVNEAVAFLADDMLQTGHQETSTPLKDDLGIHPGHSDIMQSVLS